MRTFWFIVVLPIAVVAWLGVTMSRDQAQLRKHELQSLLDGRLADVRSRVDQAMSGLDRRLSAVLESAPTESDGLRELGRKEPLARQFFTLDAQGRLLFPAAGAQDSSERERQFLLRTANIWSGEAVLLRPDAAETTKRSSQRPEQTKSQVRNKPSSTASHKSAGGDSLVDLAGRSVSGWLPWYWAEGLHLLYWRRAGTATGGVIGLEVERIALLAKVVSALPTTELEAGRMVLVDSRGSAVHQWGPHEPRPDETPAASLTLAAPLDSWSLEYYVTPTQERLLGGALGLPMILGGAALALVFIGLSVYTYREYSRGLRVASERVSFVTQVSHELKTPLTNIRMYAEILEDALQTDEAESENAHRASVIVSESQRLTRLINNILTFSRGSSSRATGRVDVDAIIGDVAQQFEPALTSRGISVELDLAATRESVGDHDTLGQIIANLLGNIDKYAASGGVARIASRDSDNGTIVTIADDGPGIREADRDAIFRPFYRVSDRLNDGVTGTGIGLAIARELARGCGGDLVLAGPDTPRDGSGACFILTLPHAPSEVDIDTTRGNTT